MNNEADFKPFQRSRRDKIGAILIGFRACAHIRYRLANMVARPLPEFMAGYAMSRLYRAAGFKGVHRGAFIASPVQITGASSNVYHNLSIADGVTVSTNVTFNLDARLTIGPRVTVSPFVRIYTATHRHGPASQRCLPEVRPRPVVIEEGCWIGLGALILPGVVVGRGTVVAAGTVVSRSTPPNSFISGSPGVVIGTIPDNADWIGPRKARAKPANTDTR